MNQDPEFLTSTVLLHIAKYFPVGRSDLNYLCSTKMECSNLRTPHGEVLIFKVSIRRF